MEHCFEDHVIVVDSTKQLTIIFISVVCRAVYASEDTLIGCIVSEFKTKWIF